MKIPLPGYLEDARGVMNALGMKKQAEELHLAINRAAESAVGEARPVFVNAIKAMTFQDPRPSSAAARIRAPSFSKARPRTRCAPSSARS